MTDLPFELLASPWTPWLLSALIVSAALAVWLDFRARRVAPVLRGLDDAIAAVEECEGPGKFRRQFGAVFQRLAANPVIGEVWRAYAPTLAPAPGQEDALGYTRRPRDSFDEGLLAVAGINLRFYNAFPNLLVGAGLLFTFLGLVAALYFASRGVAAASVEVAQQALRELLAAATFKFVTSIAGLGSSMLFSWREKALLYRLQRKLARFSAALEERMVPITAESVGIAQLAELRQQQTELQRLGRSLLVRVPETVEERLAGELVAALRPLREATAAAAGRLARIDEWLLDLVLDAAEPGPASEAGARAGPGRRASAVLDRLDELVAALRAAPLDGGAIPGPAQAAPPRAERPEAGRASLPELLGDSRALVRAVDSRLGEALLRVRDLLARVGGGKRPSRADLDTGARLLLEAQGGLQQAKAASLQLGQRLDTLAREGEAVLGALARNSAPEATAFRDQLGALGHELRHAARLLEAGTTGAIERLALAADRLGAAEAAARTG